MKFWRRLPGSYAFCISHLQSLKIMVCVAMGFTSLLFRSNAFAFHLLTVDSTCSKILRTKPTTNPLPKEPQETLQRYKCDPSLTATQRAVAIVGLCSAIHELNVGALVHAHHPSTGSPYRHGIKGTLERWHVHMVYERQWPIGGRSAQAAYLILIRVQVSDASNKIRWLCKFFKSNVHIVSVAIWPTKSAWDLSCNFGFESNISAC